MGLDTLGHGGGTVDAVMSGKVMVGIMGLIVAAALILVMLVARVDGSRHQTHVARGPAISEGDVTRAMRR